MLAGVAEQEKERECIRGERNGEKERRNVVVGFALSIHRVGLRHRATSRSLRLASNLLLLVELCHGRMHIYAVNYNL